MKQYRRVRFECTECGKLFRTHRKCHKHVVKHHTFKGVRKEMETFWSWVYTIILILIVGFFILGRCNSTYSYEDEDYARDNYLDSQYEMIKNQADPGTRTQLERLQREGENLEGDKDRKYMESEDFNERNNTLTNHQKDGKIE